MHLLGKKRTLARLKNHGFWENFSFYFGKSCFMMIYVSDHGANQNLYPFPIRKYVSVPKIFARSFSSTSRPICIHMHPFSMEELSPPIPFSISCPHLSHRHQHNRHLGTFFRLIRSSVVLSSFSCICCKVFDTSSIQPQLVGGEKPTPLKKIRVRQLG